MTATTAAARVESRATTREIPPFAAWGVCAIAALGALALLLAINRYGFFGDELYFLAAGDRLNVSYADQGPALPAIAHLMDLIAPGSLFALRLPAVLVTVGAIVVAALIARELGGARGAQLLAAGAYATSPLLLPQGNLLATNTVDTALWTVITWLVVRWVRTRADRLLLLAAVVTALDFQVKWLIPFFWICAGVSVLVFGPRDLLRRPMLWLGAGIVVLTALPSLIWQASHGWPQLQMGAVIAAEMNTVSGRLIFLPVALISLGVLGLLLFGYGLWRLFRAPELRAYRFLGLTMLLLFGVFLLVGARPYYAAGMYAVVLAAGAVELTRRNLRTWVRWLTVPLVAVSAAVTVAALPWQPASALEPPRSFADTIAGLTIYGQFGWPELAAQTSTAYRQLPAPVKQDAVVFADSYWQASAIDQFGTGLPPVYSPSRGFGYFGSPPDSTKTVLYVGNSVSQLRPMCGSMRQLDTVNARLGFPGATRGVGIWVCEQPKVHWSAAWPGLRGLR